MRGAPLEKLQRAAAPFLNPGGFPEEPVHFRGQDFAHPVANLLVLVEKKAKTFRQRQDPHAHGNVRHHFLDEPGRRSAHEFCSARRARTPPFTRERDCHHPAAGLAFCQGHAFPGKAAREEVAQGCFRVRGNGRRIAVERIVRLDKKRLEIVLDELVEVRLPRVARAIHGRAGGCPVGMGAGHAPNGYAKSAAPSRVLKINRFDGLVMAKEGHGHGRIAET